MTKRNGRTGPRSRRNTISEQVLASPVVHVANSPEPSGGTGAEDEPTNWEQQIAIAAVALMGMIVDRKTTGTVAFAPEEAEAIRAASAAVTAGAEERTDFFDQAMALAKDRIGGFQAEIAALRAEDADGRIIFSTLDHMPAELMGQPLQALPHVEETRLAVPGSLTEYEWRSLHLAAHVKVGVTLIRVPGTASFAESSSTSAERFAFSMKRREVTIVPIRPMATAAARLRAPAV